MAAACNVLFRRMGNPISGAIGALSQPLSHTALGLLLLLAFVPITIGQNVTQAALIIFSALLLAMHAAQFTLETLGVLAAICGVALGQAIALANSPALHKHYITPSVYPGFLLAGPAVFLMARKCSPQELRSLVRRLSTFLLWFFSFECVTRFLFSPWIRIRTEQRFGNSVPLNDNFYAYKFGFFYSDSNNVGLALICLLALLLVFHETVGRWRIALAFLLVLGTLSRASIVAAICQLMVFALWRKRRWLLGVFLLLQPLIIYGLFLNYVSAGDESYRSVDGSLASKLMILRWMVELYQRAGPVQKLFGVGAGNTQSIIGIAAHNILATFVLELGYAGALLIILYCWSLARRSQTAGYLLLVPIVINGFSLVLTSMPYFYVTLGLLGSLSDADWRGDNVPVGKR